MANIIISEKLIELNLPAAAKEEVLANLAGKLDALGCVNPGFYEGVIHREEQFPTGLPTAIPIALCHTEAHFVRQSALSVATLATPVKFQEMGTPERSVEAEIVFLLALNDPKQQVPWLKKMITLFRNQAYLETIKNQTDPAELARFLSDMFAN